jgi:hypothetical protein
MGQSLTKLQLEPTCFNKARSMGKLKQKMKLVDNSRTTTAKTAQQYKQK